jgi:PAS domain S-box-containing protein
MDQEYKIAESSLELLHNISQELLSNLELRPVLTRVLFLALNHVGGISGSIIVLDDNKKPVESAIVHTGQVYDKTTQQLRATLDHGLAGWVVQHQEPVLITDTSIDERWLRRRDDSPERTGPKAAVSAPLMAQGKLVGVMTLVHSTPGFFTEEHLSLVQAIADQAGIAALNARLYEESKRQARIMTALAESAAAINGALRLDEVLQRILDQISQALGVEAVSLALLDPVTNELEFRAASGLASQDILGTRLKIGQGIVGWVAKEARPVIVPKVRQDPNFYAEVDRRTGFETRAIAAAPILSQGEVIGVLEAFNPLEGSFTSDTMLVLTGIGSLAGTAIQNASLFESLQAAHQRYRDLFEYSIDPIFITNWHGLIRGANARAARVTGYDKDSLLEMSIDQLHEVDQAKIGEDLARLTPDRNLSYESLLITKGGREISVEVYARQVNIDGVQRLQWLFRDITERRNLEHLREDLTFMIYHDLRAPLSNVNYSLEALREILPENTEPSTQSIIDVAARSVGRIQRLTNSLLDIQRLESGQTVTNKAPMSMRELIEDSAEIVLPIAAAKKQGIHTDLPAGLPKVEADGEMIRRVLINLIENATKYNQRESEIHVGALQEGNQVHVWVQDQGPGIPPEDHQNIFNKYARLSSQSQGFGLGLAFCRLAVEAHGGKIWVESKPGEGAKFIFSLPVLKT